MIWALVSGLYIAAAGVLTACSRPPPVSEVEISLGLQGNIQQKTQSYHVLEMRFFLHDIFLLDVLGNRMPLQLNIPGSRRQSSQVALVDLSDGTSPQVIKGQMVDQGVALNGIEFKLGLPFALNHSDPLVAEPPLNDASMFWVWQQGYKFLLFDFIYHGEGNQGRGKSFHLGSTGCRSASALRPPAQACSQPNIVTVKLTGFDPTSRTINVDLDRLILPMLEVADGGCTGDYKADTNCTKIIEALGLDVNTGQCIDNCMGQILFN